MTVRPHALALLALLCLALTPATQAKTHADWSGDVYHEKSHETEFTVTGEGKQKLSLTLSFKNNKAGSGRMRVHFFVKNRAGTWRQIEQFRVMIKKDLKRTTKTISLPPGQYKVEMDARRGLYALHLADL